MTFQDIKDIRSLISSLVADKIDAGKVVNQQWTVTEILNSYDDIEGEDKDFYLRYRSALDRGRSEVCHREI